MELGEELRFYRMRRTALVVSKDEPHTRARKRLEYLRYEATSSEIKRASFVAGRANARTRRLSLARLFLDNKAALSSRLEIDLLGEI